MEALKDYVVLNTQYTRYTVEKDIEKIGYGDFMIHSTYKTMKDIEKKLIAKRRFYQPKLYTPFFHCSHR